MVSKELIAASTKSIILGVLAQGDSYGYEIIQRVRSQSDGVLCWADGMLYPVLHRMERDGLIESYWKEIETGRKRKYYTLTAKGNESLAHEQQQWMTVHQTLMSIWKTKTATS